MTLRREDERLLRGRGHFVDDVNRPGQLWLRVVRASVAHARLLAVDTTAARALPGVHAALSAADLPVLLVGTVVSFVVAWIVVRWLLRYIATHSFVPFAWYRIAFGLVVLATAWSGVVVWQD